jgi:hypothetical protein
LPFIKTKEQREYEIKLRNEINSFIINYKKRYKLFPWGTFNKISSVKSISDKIITIDGIEYTTRELIKRVNQKRIHLNLQLKNSYYNYIINGFLKETHKKDLENIKLIYNDYSSQLKVIFKDMQSDLSFCLVALKSVNKLLKEKEVVESVYNKFHIQDNIKEREDSQIMLGYIITESNEELDLRDFYLECFNDITFNDDIFTEGSSDDVYKSLMDIQKEIKDLSKEYKKSLKDSDYTGAKNAIEGIKKQLKELVSVAKSIDPSDKNTLVAAIKSLNVIIKTTVVMTPNSGSITNTISILRNEKEKNDNIDADSDKSEILKQIVSSTQVIIKVCDSIEKEIRETEAEEKKSSKEVVEEAAYREKILAVYRSHKNGEITLEEREDIIEALENERFIQESSINEEESISNKERFDNVVKALYERCHNGEFDIDQREMLIEKAREMIYGEEEKDDVEEDGESETTVDPQSENDLNANSSSNDLINATNKLADGLKNINIKTE